MYLHDQVHVVNQRNNRLAKAADDKHTTVVTDLTASLQQKPGLEGQGYRFRGSKRPDAAEPVDFSDQEIEEDGEEEEEEAFEEREDDRANDPACIQCDDGGMASLAAAPCCPSLLASKGDLLFATARCYHVVRWGLHACLPLWGGGCCARQ